MKTTSREKNLRVIKEKRGTMCNTPYPCETESFVRGKRDCASKMPGIDRRKPVKILRTKQVSDMVFTEGEEWLVDEELEKILIQHNLIS